MTDSSEPGRPDPAPSQAAFDGLLRTLPVWHPSRTRLPSFDTHSAPDTPLPLFHDWFTEVAAAGQTEPQTMSLATADEQGRADVRIVMLHGADADGWWFATHASSRKGRQLRTTPYATLGFYWPVQGRQVRVRGPVRAQPREAGQADLRARSTGALASALVGRQSEVLDSYGRLVRASEAAWDRAGREPGAEAPSWTLYLLTPDEVEFFQGDIHRRHVRLRYRLLTPPAGTDAASPSTSASTSTSVSTPASASASAPASTPAGPNQAPAWKKELLWP